MANFVPVSDIKKIYPDFPVSTNALRKMYREGVNPSMFIRFFRRRLLVDVDEFYAFAEKVREQS